MTVENSSITISDFIYIYFSCVTFLRDLFPASYYSGQEISVEGSNRLGSYSRLHIKRLIKGRSTSSDVLYAWIETAGKEADRQNLDSVTLCIHLDPLKPTDFDEVYRVSINNGSQSTCSQVSGKLTRYFYERGSFQNASICDESSPRGTRHIWLAEICFIQFNSHQVTRPEISQYENENQIFNSRD